MKVIFANPLAALIVLAGVMFAGSLAAEIPFRDDAFRYELEDERLADFLEEFFEDQGLQVVLSAMVEAQPGRLFGPQTGSGEEIFERIADSNQLIAYHDGFAVYIYKLSESQIRYLDIPADRIGRFDHAARDMRLADDINTLQVRHADGFAVARGTPRFVEQVEELAQAFGVSDEEDLHLFRSFKLRYAWASDTTVEVGNRIVTIPGIATILRELLYGPSHGPMAGRQEQVRRPTARRLRGLGLGADPRLPDDLYDDRDYADPRRPVEGGGQMQTFATPTSLSGAHIVADPYRNAVIVRDREENFEIYESLIETLDIEPAVIEIEATIIDVDLREMRRLGVDWQFRSSRNEIIFASDEIKDNFVETIAGQRRGAGLDVLEQRPGLQIATLIGDSRTFLARINALEDEGITNVISRPQIITLNDVEAVIENTESLYIPVSGSFEVDLFNVNAGTVMRVTPHRILEGEEERLRLIVALEDGMVTASEMAGSVVPLTRRTRINTQALVSNGQSLLLGGLTQESSGLNTEGVPFLRRIPLLGRLFSQEQRRRDHTERLFLITPRLIPLNEITGQHAPADIGVELEDLEEISRERVLRDW